MTRTYSSLSRIEHYKCLRLPEDSVSNISLCPVWYVSQSKMLRTMGHLIPKAFRRILLKEFLRNNVSRLDIYRSPFDDCVCLCRSPARSPAHVSFDMIPALEHVCNWQTFFHDVRQSCLAVGYKVNLSFCLLWHCFLDYTEDHECEWNNRIGIKNNNLRKLLVKCKSFSNRRQCRLTERRVSFYLGKCGFGNHPGVLLNQQQHLDMKSICITKPFC